MKVRGRMADVLIVDAVRTPRGAARDWGALKKVTPVNLLRPLFHALDSRSGAAIAGIDDVVLGCVTQTVEQGGNVAKLAVNNAGWDPAIPGATINRYCASGLAACNVAVSRIAAGSDAAMIAGGVESMSRVEMLSDDAPVYTDPSLRRSMQFVPTGIVADLLATLENISRGELDAYGIESHRRAARAKKEGRFQRSLISVRSETGEVLLDHDEIVRPDKTAEEYASRDPAFIKLGAAGADALALADWPDIAAIDHQHHGWISPGMVDGAGVVAFASDAAAARFKTPPRARVVAWADAGARPAAGLTAARIAAQKALAMAGLAASDIDLFECNESFAVTPIKFARDLGVNLDRVNVNGGAISLGHPMGASGAMLLGTLLDELERQGLTRGLVAICGALGVGSAMIIDRV